MHVVLFPFMSKGHTIPLLQLARILLHRYRHRGVAVTVITTPANHPFVSTALSATDASIIALPFPEHVHPDIPSGTESTDALPSISLFPYFAVATKSMQPRFEAALEGLVNLHTKASFVVVSDGFLWWTLESCNKFGLPRLVLYGMSNYAMAVMRVAARDEVLVGVETDEVVVALTEFPWVKVSRGDLPSSAGLVTGPESQAALAEFQRVFLGATMRSYGLLVNSFHELEPAFDDFMKGNQGKSWSIGPLCLHSNHNPNKPTTTNGPPQPNRIIKWLDGHLAQGHRVLYVAFGTQAQLSVDQLKEIAIGLEKSTVNFLWVIKNCKSKVPCGLEERVNGRGMLVNEWVDQREILAHPSIKGFLSHCGWNSVLESVCSGVPIIAWPLMAEQPLNAKMVVEELRIGVRVVGACDSGLVGWERVEEKVEELMGEGERGEEARRRVKEYQELARKAMEEGSGSSWRSLDMFVDEICNHKQLG